MLLRARALRRLRRILPRRLLRARVAATRPWTSGRRYEFMIESLGRGVPAPHGAAGLLELDKDRLLQSRNGRRSAFDFLAERFGSAQTEIDIARIGLAHEFGLRLPELLLMRVDKMTMASSVEARAPYLDPQLFEFAARLPFSLHWDDGEGKRILKRAFRDVVPREVLARKRRGFGAPRVALVREPAHDRRERADARTGLRLLLPSRAARVPRDLEGARA